MTMSVSRLLFYRLQTSQDRQSKVLNNVFTAVRCSSITKLQKSDCNAYFFQIVTNKFYANVISFRNKHIRTERYCDANQNGPNK